MFSKFKTLKLATLAFATLLAGGAIADTIKIAGWGATSGPLRSFCCEKASALDYWFGRRRIYLC